jgi:hypothetical protein
VKLNRAVMSIVITGAGTVVLSGCAPTDKAVVAEARSFLDTVGEEYVAYVEADESLSPTSKQVRIDRVESFGGVISALEASD